MVIFIKKNYVSQNINSIFLVFLFFISKTYKKNYKTNFFSNKNYLNLIFCKNHITNVLFHVSTMAVRIWHFNFYSIFTVFR